MDKPVIAVDIDDVLANSSDALRLEVNKRLQVNLLPEHYQVPGEYDTYYEEIWRTHGLEGRVSMAELHIQMVADQSHIKPSHNAFQTLQALSKHFELIIVTGRQENQRSATQAWLNRHFPGIFSKVLFGGGL